MRRVYVIGIFLLYLSAAVRAEILDVVDLSAPGVSEGVVRVLAPHGDQLVVAGDFRVCEGDSCAPVALVDGAYCRPLGGPWLGFEALAAVSHAGEIVVAGDSPEWIRHRRIQPAGCGPYVWRDEEWVPLAQGLEGRIEAMSSYAGDLYVVGHFTCDTDRHIRNVARWDGRRWRALGDLAFDGLASVSCLAVYRGEIVIGGSFAILEEERFSNIASWDGREWRPLGDGANEAVLALQVHGGLLHAGGRFTHIGAVDATRVAAWNGSTWSGLGDGLGAAEICGREDEVRGFMVYERELYAMGYFRFDGPGRPHGLARWTGTRWVSALVRERNTTSDLSAVAVNDGRVFAAPAEASHGNSTLGVIENGEWTPFGCGHGPWTYGIGQFRLSSQSEDRIWVIAAPFAGNKPVNGLAYWTGAEWTAPEGWIEQVELNHGLTPLRVMGRGDDLLVVAGRPPGAIADGGSSRYPERRSFWRGRGGEWRKLPPIPAESSSLINHIAFDEGILRIRLEEYLDTERRKTGAEPKRWMIEWKDDAWTEIPTPPETSSPPAPTTEPVVRISESDPDIIEWTRPAGLSRIPTDFVFEDADGRRRDVSPRYVELLCGELIAYGRFNRVGDEEAGGTAVWRDGVWCPLPWTSRDRGVETDRGVWIVYRSLRTLRPLKLVYYTPPFSCESVSNDPRMWSRSESHPVTRVGLNLDDAGTEYVRCEGDEAVTPGEWNWEARYCGIETALEIRYQAPGRFDIVMPSGEGRMTQLTLTTTLADSGLYHMTGEVRCLGGREAGLTLVGKQEMGVRQECGERIRREGEWSRVHLVVECAADGLFECRFGIPDGCRRLEVRDLVLTRDDGYLAERLMSFADRLVEAETIVGAASWRDTLRASMEDVVGTPVGVFSEHRLRGSLRDPRLFFGHDRTYPTWYEQPRVAERQTCLPGFGGETRDQWDYARTEDGILYLRPVSFDSVPDRVWDCVRSARGLVLDLRDAGWPDRPQRRGDRKRLEAFAACFVAHRTEYARLCRRGWRRFFDPRYEWSLEPGDEGLGPLPIVVLIDESTGPRAAQLALMFDAVPSARLVGRPTCGVEGRTVYRYLIDGCWAAFPDPVVRTLDGRNVTLEGVAPDEYVPPSDDPTAIPVFEAGMASLRRMVSGAE